MKLKTIRRFAIVTVFVASPVVFGWNPPTGGLVTGQIAWIQVAATGGIHFALVGAPAICAVGGSGNSAIGELLPGQSTAGGVNTADGIRAVLSSLTSAKLAGKRIKVYADNYGVWGCKVGAIDVDP